MNYNKHANAVHVIRTNMNFLRIQSLSGGVEEYKIKYFMMWLFFHQVIIFLALRKQFHSKEDWDRFVLSKILIIRQVIEEFILISNVPKVDRYLDKMLPAAEEIFNLAADNNNVDLQLILKDAITNRNDYLKTSKGLFIEQLISGNLEVAGIYTEAKALHILQSQFTDKAVVMQFELQNNLTQNMMEEINSSKILNLVDGHQHQILYLIVSPM